MKNLRKQIKESFFNPILHLFPLLLFLVIDEFYGLDLAWMITFPITILLVIYIYFAYNRIFTWHLVVTGLFVGVSSLASIQSFFIIPEVLRELNYELIVVVALIGILIYRKKIQTGLNKLLSTLIPMTNNFDEMFRVLKVLLILLVIYISSFSTLYYLLHGSVGLYIETLRQFYLGTLIFFTVYELTRVQIVRAKLIKEEWWPIINNNGKIVGSIQYITSLNDEKKYMHPIVRVMIIEKGRILLQKRSHGDLVFGGLWDTAISNHVKMGENIEKCVERTAEERYKLRNFKYMYLSNYMLELKEEKHYAFLFVSCQQMELKPNTELIEQTKWWTQQQIEENIDSDIFSDNFRIEFDLIKRSGLIESEKCECNCRLKETIYKQSNVALNN